MAEKNNVAKPTGQAHIQGAAPDEQARRILSTLDEPWIEITRRRTQTAHALAIGLLRLFELIVIWGGAITTILVIAIIFTDRPIADLTAAYQQALDFVKALLPFIATPLGVALGYYFREKVEE